MIKFAKLKSKKNFEIESRSYKMYVENQKTKMLFIIFSLYQTQKFKKSMLNFL